MVSGVKLHHVAIVFDDYLVHNTWNVDTMYHLAFWCGNLLVMTSQYHNEQFMMPWDSQMHATNDCNGGVE